MSMTLPTLLCVSLVVAGLLVLNFRTLRRVEGFKPLVIRIDDVGRAQAVQFDALMYTPVGQAERCHSRRVSLGCRRGRRRRDGRTVGLSEHAFMR